MSEPKKSRVKYPEALLVRMTKKQKRKLVKCARSGAKKEAEIVRGYIDTLPE